MTFPTIKLLVVDIDGCLIQGEKAPYDFAALAAIRELNEAATPQNAIPYATLCSGRPYPYVEAMLKLIGGQLPAIFEHGCGLYFPGRDLHRECAYHPGALRSRAARQAVEDLVERVLAETGAGRQCAKGSLVTFFPPPGQDVAAFADYVAERIVAAGLPLEVGHTFTSVDVTPQGVNKATGLRWLLAELAGESSELSLNLNLEQVAAVGDSPSDIGFMTLAGFSAAPANANPQVLAVAGYVSPLRYTQGVLDIYRRVIASNKEP